MDNMFGYNQQMLPNCKDELDVCDHIDSGLGSIDPDRLNSGASHYSSYNSDLGSINPPDLGKDDLGKNLKSIDEERLDTGFSENFQDLDLNTDEEIEISQEELDCYHPDEENDTGLQISIIKGESELSFRIIESCPNPQLLDIKNEWGQTAMHLAVLTDQPQIVRCLVACGANFTCKDMEGNTPLHLASERGLSLHVDMLTLKLNKEEDFGLQSRPIPQNLDEMNYNGFAPLHLACINNRIEVMKILINELYCDVNIGDGKSGRTPLHHATERKNSKAVNLLLKCETNQVDALTFAGCSALHLAAAKGHRMEIRELLDHGADLFLITCDDMDVFELAAANPVTQRRTLSVLMDSEKRHRAQRVAPNRSSRSR